MPRNPGMTGRQIDKTQIKAEQVGISSV
jgi:hypothetical protein